MRRIDEGPGSWIRNRLRTLGCTALVAGGLLSFPTAGVTGDWAACLQGQRAILLVKTRIQGTGSQTSSINDPQFVFPISSQFQQAGLTLLDEQTAQNALTERQKELILAGDAVGALAATREMGATLLMNAHFTGQEMPIRGLTTNLRTVVGQISIKVLAAETGKILAEQQHAFRNAGMGAEAVLSGMLMKEIPSLSERILAQMCGNMPAAAPPARPAIVADEPPLPGAGGAAIEAPAAPDEPGVEGVLKRQLKDL